MLKSFNEKNLDNALRCLKNPDYKIALKSLPSDVLHMLLYWQNLSFGRFADDAEKVVEAIRKMPPTSKIMIAWRCGKIIGNKAVSASFDRTVAKKFQVQYKERIHCIVLLNGCRFLPTVFVNEVLLGSYHEDPELEILLDVSRLKWCMGVYVYI